MLMVDNGVYFRAQIYSNWQYSLIKYWLIYGVSKKFIVKKTPSGTIKQSSFTEIYIWGSGS